LERSEKQQIEGKKKKELVVITESIAFSDISEARIVITFK